MRKRYDVLSNTDLNKLIESVEYRMEKGWCLAGGVHVSEGVIGVTYYQAMTWGAPDEG